MPDANDPRGRGPADWSDAFAALPQEAPPTDAWTRVSARLDARGQAGRRRPPRVAGWIGLATAAALALVVAWPRQERAPDTDRAVDASPPAVASRAAPARPSSAGTSAPAPAAASPLPTTPAGSALAASGRKPGGEATAIALPKAVETSRKPRYAVRQAPRATGPADAQPLDALYAESARLEALLALARDDRVATASAALLSAELDAQVAGIDVRLAQPGLDDAQRTALWRARVDALRQAAGFESTQRILAAQGDGGALLVSVD